MNLRPWLVLVGLAAWGLAPGCGGGGSRPPLLAPVLAAPADGAELLAPPALYAWSSAGDGATYRLRVVEVRSFQTPAQALGANPVHLAVTLSATSYAVAPGDPALLAGRCYAWRVEALRGGEAQASAPGWLRLRLAGETCSRADAISILLERLVVPATRERPVTVYLDRNPLPAGTRVWPWDEPGAAHEVAAPAWFAWIDDDPQAFFAHDTRLVFVDAATGAVTVQPSSWWPVVDEVSVWMDDDAWADLTTIVCSERHRVP